MALWYDDFTVGRSFVTGRRRVTAEDIRRFAELSGDDNPIHRDAEAARAAGFAGPVAHGALGLALATGLVSRLGLTHGTLKALAGLSVRFRHPVMAGDALEVVLTVTAQRATRDPSRGLVTFGLEVRNQGGVTVQVGELSELIARRE